jgi:hypothetical protein
MDASLFTVFGIRYLDIFTRFRCERKIGILTVSRYSRKTCFGKFLLRCSFFALLAQKNEQRS